MRDRTKFAYELRDLINRHSVETASDTPDGTLVRYLLSCLDAYEQATRERAARAYTDNSTVPRTADEGSPEPTAKRQLLEEEADLAAEIIGNVATVLPAAVTEQYESWLEVNAARKAAKRIGIPYSIAEVKAVLANHHMDEYHRSLMEWLFGMVERNEHD